MTEQYTDFLKAKVAVVEWQGIDIATDRLHPSTLPHQADAIRWMLRIGRGLLAASFGLGKTHAQVEAARIIVEEKGGKFLVVTPLGVRHQFIEEDGPRLDVPFKYVATDAEVEAADTPFLVTNYERIREGHINPGQFTGISLDEGSVLRSLGSDTYAVFEKLCKDIPFRYVATATPSPNNEAHPGKGVRGEHQPAHTVAADQGAPKAFLADSQNSNIRMADEPSHTVTAQRNKVQARAWLGRGRVVSMTTHALARFQSFPDTTIWPEGKTAATRLIGNAVPPKMAAGLLSDLSK